MKYVAVICFFILWGVVGSISNGNTPLGVGIGASVFTATVGLLAALAGGMFEDEENEDQE